MMSKVVYQIQKSFGKVKLYEKDDNLVIEFIPILDGKETDSSDPNYCMIQIDKPYLGEFLVTCRCFLHGIESSDFVFVRNRDADDEVVVRLYKDRQKNEEECWLRLVTGKTEEKRKRIRLTKRDLVCISTALEAIIFD